MNLQVHGIATNMTRMDTTHEIYQTAYVYLFLFFNNAKRLLLKSLRSLCPYIEFFDKKLGK